VGDPSAELGLADRASALADPASALVSRALVSAGSDSGSDTVLDGDLASVRAGVLAGVGVIHSAATAVMALATRPMGTVDTTAIRILTLIPIRPASTTIQITLHLPILTRHLPAGITRSLPIL
jgi:hypothetical protein